MRPALGRRSVGERYRTLQQCLVALTVDEFVDDAVLVGVRSRDRIADGAHFQGFLQAGDAR